MVEIYAHRGGRGLAPENTLYASEVALRLGVHYLDFDIVMTKDNVLVVYHDPFLNPDITRDTKGKFITSSIPINELTYDQLQAYNIGQVNPSSVYATFFPMQIQLENANIPTLKQAIEHAQSISGKKVGFQVEMKTSSNSPPLPESFAKALYRILKETNSVVQTEVQSFDFRCLLALQKLDAQIKTAYLTPSTDPLVEQFSSKPSMVKTLGGSCWGPYEMHVTQEEIEEAHALGLKVVVWGHPEEEGTDFNYARIVQLIEWGIDGIITDRPDVLRGILSSRGYSVPHGY